MKEKRSANKLQAPVKPATVGPAANGEIRSTADIAAYVAKVESAAAEVMELLQRAKQVIRWTAVGPEAKGKIAPADAVEIFGKIEFAAAKIIKLLELTKDVSELPMEARECFDYLDRLGRATDPGSHILADWMLNLEFDEAMAIMPLLRPLAKKRGRRPGRSQTHAKIEDQAYMSVFLNKSSKQTLAAVAREFAKLRKSNPTSDEIKNIARDLRRAQGRTKKG